MSIPKILHQLWIGPKEAPHKMMETWREKHTDFEYIFWNEAEIEKRGIQFRCQSQIDAMQEWNGKADIMRWEILYRYGGYFVDADSICIHPFDDYFEGAGTVAFATFENETARTGLVATGTMGFVPGYPLCGDIIDWIVSPDAVDLLVRYRAWGSVGPHALTRFLNTGKYRDFSVFPSHCFLPIHFTGVFYEGHKKVYAYQAWGNTNDLYDTIHEIDLPAQLKEPPFWVSVLIPSYNTPAHYLKECLESILLQKGYFGIELVCINDGSTPEYTAILEEALYQFQKKSRFCRLIYSKEEVNRGVAHSLKIGVEKCNHELIFRMDADDLMLPERIQTQILFMRDHPDCVVCGTNVQLFQNHDLLNKTNKTLLSSTAHPERLEWKTFLETQPAWFMNHPTLCFRKSAVLAVGNYCPEISWFEDYDLELRLMKRYGVVYNIPESLVMYRIHPGQVTAKDSGSEEIQEKKNLFLKLLTL